MMPSFLLWLSDEDRKRLGCEQETLTVELLSVTAREAALMQQPFFPGKDGLEGFESPNAWREALRGAPLIDSTGAPVMEEVQEEKQEDGSSKPVMRQKRAPNWGANLALVWLALRRAEPSVNVPLAELDYDVDAARFFFQPDEESEPEGQGKDDAGGDPGQTSSD